MPAAVAQLVFTPVLTHPARLVVGRAAKAEKRILPRCRYRADPSSSSQLAAAFGREAAPAERRKLLRDGLRLTLWRVTGTTGAWLPPDALARKRAQCGVLDWQYPARHPPNSTDSLLVRKYNPGLSVWAVYGGYGI